MNNEVEIPYAINLTREEITTFLQHYLSKFKGFSNINKDPRYGTNTALFISEDPEKLLIEMNSAISVALNEHIETIFEESCKKYNRNIIFYESEIRGNTLNLRW